MLEHAPIMPAFFSLLLPSYYSNNLACKIVAFLAISQDTTGSLSLMVQDVLIVKWVTLDHPGCEEIFHNNLETGAPNESEYFLINNF